MLGFIKTLTLTLVFSTILCGCEDKSVASSENLTEAINSELSKQIIWMALPGSSVTEGTVSAPFVIVDPYNSKNSETNYAGKKDYLKRVIDYAKLLERHKSLKLTEDSFTISAPFIGSVRAFGYTVKYNQDLLRTIQTTPFYGLSKAQAGTVELKDIINSTTVFEKDGEKCIDITFSIKMSQKLDCIDDEILESSAITEEISSLRTTYRLVLDENAKRWIVRDPAPLQLDPVKKFFKFLIDG